MERSRPRCITGGLGYLASVCPGSDASGPQRRLVRAGRVIHAGPSGACAELRRGLVWVTLLHQCLGAGGKAGSDVATSLPASGLALTWKPDFLVAAPAQAA